MIHLHTFFNTKVTIDQREKIYQPGLLAQKDVNFGDWCLTPIRVLCQGEHIQIRSSKDRPAHTWHINELEVPSLFCPFMQVVIAIILLFKRILGGKINLDTIERDPTYF